MVRLKELAKSQKAYRSIKFQFPNGSIKRYQDHVVCESFLRFQFPNGSIKRFMQGWRYIFATPVSIP